MFNLDLSPSDLILLNSQEFATPGHFLEPAEILPTGARVSLIRLVEALLTGAFMAHEQKGVAKLAIKQKTRPYGRDSLVVAWCGNEVAWPTGTLESQLDRSIRELQSAHQATGTEALIRSLFPYSMVNPWRGLVDSLLDGLVARGVLHQREENQKLLHIFASGQITYFLPDEHFAPVRAEAHVLGETLSVWQSSRPLEVALLHRSISSAMRHSTDWSVSVMA